MKITALIVDDEPIARRKLNRLIADVPWLEPIGEASTGALALEAISRHRPDLVFLDICMPGLSGIDVVMQLRELNPAPAVIFTTAHESYAVTAFELQAVDYLLKPFGPERFRSAVERARENIAHRGAAAALERAQAALASATNPPVLDRILVRQGQAVVPLSLDEIVRIEAEDDYVQIHARGRRFLVSLRLNDLERRLPRPPFVRVHRSHLVNFDHVGTMTWRDDARLDIQLTDGSVVAASRIRSKELRRQSH